MKLFIVFAMVVCSSRILMAQTQADIEKMIKEANQIANSQNKQTQTKTLPAAKYKSPIIPIPVKQPVTIPSAAQAKDQLLWYKGKKLNDSMLVTPKGMLVLFSKKRNLVITQPLTKTDPFLKIINNLTKSKLWTETYISKEAARKNGFMNYPLIQMAVDEFKDIEERYNAIVKNTIDLPLPNSLLKNNIIIPKHKGGSGSVELNERVLTAEAELDEMHKNLKELLRNEPEMLIDAPPKRDFSLAYLCDSNAQKKYKQERLEWEKKFLDYENQLLSYAIGINRYMQLTGTISITKTEPGSPSLTDDLNEAFTKSLSRADEKIKRLTNQNGKNIFMQDCVLNSILANDRKKQLLGMDENLDGMSIISELMESAEFENYIEQKIIERDWDVIFNISITLGRNRQGQILGKGELSERLNDLFYRIMNLNRFSLNTTVNFATTYKDSEDEPVLRATGDMVNREKVYVSLARNGCKWTLHLTNTDYENGKESEYYIPVIVTSGIKQVKTEQDKWISYSYTGPKDMLMHFPVFKMDFADLINQDTVILQQLRYDPKENLANYASQSGKSYSIDLLGYLSHVFISSSKAEANEDKLMTMANNMMNTFTSVALISTGYALLDQLRDKHKRMQQKLEMEKTIAAVAFVSNTTFAFDAFNKSPVLTDISADTKHSDKQVEVSKGLIKIKIVHDPIINK